MSHTLGCGNPGCLICNNNTINLYSPQSESLGSGMSSTGTYYCSCGQSHPLYTICPNNYNIIVTTPTNILPYSSIYSTKIREINIYSGYNGENPYQMLECKCSKCEVTKPVDQIAKTYGYCKILRHICIQCEVEMLDKQYGLSNNIELESVLFKK